MAIPRETVFPTDKFDTRLHNTRKVMESRQIDVLILHSAPNVYYLCGHQSLNLWDYQCLIVPPDLRSGELLWDSTKNHRYVGIESFRSKFSFHNKLLVIPLKVNFKNATDLYNKSIRILIILKPMIFLIFFLCRHRIAALLSGCGSFPLPCSWYAG